LRFELRSLRHLVWALPAALAAAALAYLWKGYPPYLSAVTGVAIGGLVFATLRTVEQMRSLGR
jgi:hypothetical protein